jgi:ParB family chromosome partitioning protein
VGPDRGRKGSKNALYIVDGHTRKCAAAKAGMSPIYAARVKFTSEDAALEYAIHNQRDRRNMTNEDIFGCIQTMDSRKPRGGDRKSQGAKSKSSSEPIENISSAQQTADIVGTSETKVKKVRSILDHADEQTKRDVESGNKTINKAYQETQQMRRREQENSGKREDACRKPKPKIDKTKIVSESFMEAFENFLTAITNEKHRKWETTSQEAVLKYLEILHDVTTIT